MDFYIVLLMRYFIELKFVYHLKLLYNTTFYVKIRQLQA